MQKVGETTKTSEEYFTRKEKKDLAWLVVVRRTEQSFFPYFGHDFVRHIHIVSRNMESKVDHSQSGHSRISYCSPIFLCKLSSKQLVATYHIASLNHLRTASVMHICLDFRECKP